MLKFLFALTILTTSIFTTVAFAQSGESSTAESAASVPKGCEAFTAEQLDKDPNAPCFEAVRPDLDPRQAEGTYYEPYLASNHKDECDGCHVMKNVTVSDDTNKNVYEMPFLKSAVPQFGQGSGSDTGTNKSGTD